MGSMSRSCFLRCLLDSHTPIKLIHNVETAIGRTKNTKIRDQSCSRQQLILKADCEKCLVEVTQVGLNASGLDGFALKRNSIYKVGHNSRIEILLNNYIHVIEFDPAPDSDCQSISSKRKLEEQVEPSRKLLKMEHNIEQTSADTLAASEDVWEEIDRGELYIYTSKGVKSSNKIAAFDMDGTLIKTKSGKVYPVDNKDWQLAFSSIKDKLEEHYNEGFKLAILSNQAPIGNGRVKIADFKIKIEDLVKILGLPFQVYISTGKGFYRKPAPGMWNFLVEQKNDDLEVDVTNCFYVGDAAGRLANWAPGKKKDHSMADKLMAENVGLRFYTPEQFFLGHSISNVPMGKPSFDPRELISATFNEQLISKAKEILVLVGYPGSGKSFVAKEIENKSDKKYATVCRDVLGSWQKCAAEATKLLERCKSVIVDSTNPDKESRSRWVLLAKELGVNCRCAKMAASISHAKHNNKFRELMKMKHIPVNDIVYNTYKSKYVEPSVSEGFKEVIDVHFAPCFEDKEAEKIYKMHLLDK